MHLMSIFFCRFLSDYVETVKVLLFVTEKCSYCALFTCFILYHLNKVLIVRTFPGFGLLTVLFFVAYINETLMQKVLFPAILFKIKTNFFFQKFSTKILAWLFITHHGTLYQSKIKNVSYFSCHCHKMNLPWHLEWSKLLSIGTQTSTKKLIPWDYFWVIS